MSLIFMDSMTRYGSTNNANAAAIIGKHGWVPNNITSHINHKTSQGMLGNDFLSLNGFYDNNNEVYLPALITRGINIGAQTQLGVYAKVAVLNSFGAQNGLQTTDFLQFNNISFLFRHSRTNSGSNFTCTPTQIGPITDLRTINSPATSSFTIVNGDSPSTWTLSSIQWMTVNIHFNWTGVSMAVTARVTTPTNVTDLTYGTMTKTGTYNSIRFGSSTPMSSGSNNSILISDVVLYTIDGIGLTNFLPTPRSIRVGRLIPTANGSLNQWTPSTGANFQTVDDTPYNETDFTRGLSVGSKQTFTFGGLGSGPDAIKSNILGIQANPVMFDTGTQVVNAAPIQVSGGTEHSLGSTITPSRSVYTGHITVQTVNPATSLPYSVSQINTLEAGIAVGS